MAGLIVNLYKTNICGAGMYRLAGYFRGEFSDTLKNGMVFLIFIVVISNHMKPLVVNLWKA
ncbi:hypothetical protein AACK17_11135 [Pectobacterium punjabense]|uniref:hypothetical protein n=1 Tax=Pectobacterium punjabense TaxID=2108399 RepID=UPI00311EDE43